MGTFTPRFSSAGMQGNPWWYSNGNPFYASGYGMPNCTCYAYGRYAEIAGEFKDLPTGDAGEWYDNVSTDFQLSVYPQLGAVACYASRSGSYAGHVAIVEQINEDGSIVTSNSAYRGTYFFLNTVSPSNGYLADWMIRSRDYYLQGFILNTAIGYGASIYVVAAICGCFWRESNINPGVWESLIESTFDHEYQYDGIGGFGLAQWTNVGSSHGRLWNLYRWCEVNDKWVYDGDAQLEFMTVEGYWANSSQTRGDYQNLEEFLLTDSTNLEDLVWDFLANFEGVPGNAYEERVEHAYACLDYIQQHMNDDTTWYWVSLNDYLYDAEIFNNAMCVWQWLSGNIGEPISGNDQNGFKLWMYIRYFL